MATTNERPAATSVLQTRIADAELRSTIWLADGNCAREAGDKKRAEECYRKFTYWRTRFNKLTGRA